MIGSRFFILILFLSTTVGAPLSALAADLSVPFELESAAVLPKGVSNPRFKTVFAPAQEKLDGTGTTLGLGSSFNKTLTWSDIFKNLDNDSQRASARSIMSKAGISDDQSPGSTTGMVNAYQTAIVPVLAYGLTARLTIGVAVPVVHTDISVDTGFVTSGAGQSFANQAGLSASNWKGEDVSNRFNNAVNEELKKNNYDPLRSQSITALGDTKLFAKYLVAGDVDNDFSVKTMLSTPTGSQPNDRQIVDPATSSGNYGLSALLLYDRKRIVGDLGFNAYGEYTYEFADSLERRVPTSMGDQVSPDAENVNRKTGDQMGVGTSLVYEFPRLGVHLGAGYNLQYQKPTSFGGTQYVQERYRWLEGLYPEEVLHSATLSTGFSTVNWYRQKRFSYPLEANFSYSRALSGVNVVKAEVIEAELVVFF